MIFTHSYLDILNLRKANSLTLTAAAAQLSWGINDTLFDDVPQHNSLQHLRELTMDKTGWNAHIVHLYPSGLYRRYGRMWRVNTGKWEGMTRGTSSVECEGGSTGGR